jgi:hypothetical protein
MDTNFSCEFQLFIEDYINGTPDELLAEAIESHLPQCAVCRKLLEATLSSQPAPDWLQLLRQSNQTPSPSLAETASRPRPLHAAEASAAEPALRLTSQPLLPSRFRLSRQIGVGGMGGVWEAVDLVLQRSVAVKVLKNSAAIHEQQRLLQEGTALGRLTHPGIVRIYEVILCRDQPAVVMELVNGPALDEYTRDRVIVEQEAAFLCMRIAAAAAHAHDNNVIHRDLKPSNILLSPASTETGVDLVGIHSQWQPMISDFGIARLVDENTITHAGQILGTPAYMAPEQTAGQPSAITASVDIYGIGAILYHLLTGRPPFVTDHSSATLALLRDADPLAPRLLRPGLSPDLENICLKCLAKRPGERYVSAAALEADLDAFLRGRPVAARPAGLILRTLKWVRRNRLPATFLTATLSLLIAIVCLSLLFAHRQREVREVAETAKRTAESEYKNAVTTRQKLERQLEAAVEGMDELMELIGNPNAFRSPLSAEQMSRFNVNALKVYKDYIDHFGLGRMTRPRDILVAVRYFSLLLHTDPAKCQVADLQRVADVFARMSPEQLNAAGMLELRCRFLEVSARAAAHRLEYSVAADLWLQAAELLAVDIGTGDKPSAQQVVQMRNQAGMCMNAALEFARSHDTSRAADAAGEACRILRVVLRAEPNSHIDHMRLLDYSLGHLDFLRQKGDAQSARIVGQAALDFCPASGYPAPHMQQYVDQARAALAAALGRMAP